MKWLIVTGDDEDEDGLVHVVPDVEGQPKQPKHKLSEKCACGPTPNRGEFSTVMVHHLPY